MLPRWNQWTLQLGSTTDLRGTDLNLPVSANTHSWYFWPHHHSTIPFMQVLAHKYSALEKRYTEGWILGWNHHKFRTQTHTEKHSDLPTDTHTVCSRTVRTLNAWITYLYWRTWKPSGPFPPFQWFQRYWVSHVSLQIEKKEVSTSSSSKPRGQIIWKHPRNSSSSLKDTMYYLPLHSCSVTGPIALLKLV